MHDVGFSPEAAVAIAVEEEMGVGGIVTGTGSISQAMTMNIMIRIMATSLRIASDVRIRWFLLFLKSVNSFHRDVTIKQLVPEGVNNIHMFWF